MTRYAIEFTLAGCAVIGAALVVYQAARLRDWLWVGFGIVFLVSPLFFALAQFRILAWGDPSWLFNQTFTIGVRVPIVIALYVVAGFLRKRRNGR